MTKKRGRKVEVEENKVSKGMYEEVITLIDHRIYINREGYEGIAALTKLASSTQTLESHLTP